MNKLVPVLAVIIILLSGVCGVLFYQISDMQSQNSDLQKQIGQLENQTSKLEDQIDELKNKESDLESQYHNQIVQLETQIGEIENRYQNQTDQLEKQITELEKQLEKEIFLRTLPDAKQVNITAFRAYGWNMVSTEVMSFCNVTVQNFGTNDVDGLTIRISGVNRFTDWTYGGEQEVALLKAGETKNINIESAQSMAFFSDITATLMLGDIIIDESTDYTGF